MVERNRIAPRAPMADRADERRQGADDARPAMLRS
jgi:hypothetical protein